jgi:hypothetical protein
MGNNLFLEFAVIKIKFYNILHAIQKVSNVNVIGLTQRTGTVPVFNNPLATLLQICLKASVTP